MAFKCIIRARTPLSLICGKSIIKQSEFFLYLLLKKSRRRLNSMQAQIWQWIILFFYVRNLSNKDIKKIKNSGLDYTISDINKVEIVINGNYNELLNMLASCNVVNVDTSTQTLEEIFMRYYGKEEN